MKYEYNNHLITQGKSIYKKVIGFIMDGNRRWAKLNSKTLTGAYSQGTHILNMTILACITYKINTVIFYALSLENFTKRSKDEINVIQNIGLKQLNENKEYFIKNKIKIQFIGNKKANKMKNHTI